LDLVRFLLELLEVGAETGEGRMWKDAAINRGGEVSKGQEKLGGPPHLNRPQSALDFQSRDLVVRLMKQLIVVAPSRCARDKNCDAASQLWLAITPLACVIEVLEVLRPSAS